MNILEIQKKDRKLGLWAQKPFLRGAETTSFNNCEIANSRETEKA
jgi:hypothetical protein